MSSRSSRRVAKNGVHPNLGQQAIAAQRQIAKGRAIWLGPSQLRARLYARCKCSQNFSFGGLKVLTLFGEHRRLPTVNNLPHFGYFTIRQRKIVNLTQTRKSGNCFERPLRPQISEVVVI